MHETDQILQLMHFFNVYKKNEAHIVQRTKLVKG